MTPRNARIAEWLKVGAIAYVNPKQLRHYRNQISELLDDPWLQVVSVAISSVEVRRYRPNPDKGWNVGVEPITWWVPAAALLPRPARPEANKTGFAMSAVVADHVEKPEIEAEEIEF